MKILCYSDSHGSLPNTLKWPEADIFIHSGDICPNWSHNWSDDGPLQLNWLLREFNPWLATIPAKFKILIGGNHDGFNLLNDFLEVLGWLPGKTDAMNAPIYLENSGCQVMGKNIWGIPNTNVPNWYRNNRWNYGVYHDNDESKMQTIIDQIPYDTNILVTHGPAYSFFDSCGENIGSKVLAQKIEFLKTRNLQLHTHGHVHEQTGYMLERVMDRKLKGLSNPFYRVNAAANLVVVDILDQQN